MRRGSMARGRGVGRGILTAALALVAVVAFPVLSVDAHPEGWSVVYRSPTSNSYLSGIDSRAPDDVWAVGTFIGPTPADGPPRVAVVHWDGRSWKLVPVSRPTGRRVALIDVAAVGPREAWAVGRAPSGALVLRWDGDRWSRVPAPDRATRNAVLAGIDRIPGTGRLWAVGDAGWRPLILHWTGRVWRTVEAPPLPKAARLYDVAAVSRRTAWAVGQVGGSPLILRFTLGRGWRRVANPAFGDGTLLGVEAIVGRAVAAGYRDGPLLLRWEGGRWSEVRWRWPGASFSLTDVDVSGSTFWVAGVRSMDHRSEPFLLRGRVRWRWIRVPSPGRWSSFTAVSVLPGSIWATAQRGEGEGNIGLVMRGP